MRASLRHADYDLAAELVQALPVPVIVSGGLRDPGHVRCAFEHTGAAAVMLARGALGNPVAVRARCSAPAIVEPGRDEIVAEWTWVLERAAEHLGPDARRATCVLRKFHPWYVERAGAPRKTQDALQRAETLDEQRRVIR